MLESRNIIDIINFFPFILFDQDKYYTLTFGLDLMIILKKFQR